jgi:hypothetical protein
MSNESEVIVEDVIETPVEPVVAEEADTPIVESNEDDTFQAAVDAKLAGMKASMDRMVKERDEALKVKTQMETDAKAVKIAQLEADGKTQEIAEMKIADLTAKLAVFESENTKLSRDSVLNGALSTLEFRSERSRDMAKKDVLDQLIQDENGMWTHKDGSSINEFVNSYSKSEENSFLFRVKANAGSGSTSSSSAPISEAKKSISEMSTEEVLRLASKGQLGKFNI